VVAKGSFPLAVTGIAPKKKFQATRVAGRFFYKEKKRLTIKTKKL